MKYCIVGCHYNGTTSLEKYLVEIKGLNVIRDEGLFTLRNGHLKYPTYHKGRKPIIILSKNKELMWINQLPKWMSLNPIIYYLEDIRLEQGFPHDMGGTACQLVTRRINTVASVENGKNMKGFIMSAVIVLDYRGGIND